MNHAGIRSALSRIAWDYLLIHLHFRLNNLDVLPDWAGYLLIFSAIGLLAGELRDLPLLRPFCILLGAVSGVDWLSFLLTGAEFTGRFFLLSALITCVALYFHFQLLTDLAALADRRSGEDSMKNLMWSAISIRSPAFQSRLTQPAALVTIRVSQPSRRSTRTA